MDRVFEAAVIFFACAFLLVSLGTLARFLGKTELRSDEFRAACFSLAVLVTASGVLIGLAKFWP